MYSTRNSRLYQLHNHTHHPSCLQVVQQTRSQDTEQSFHSIFGFLFGKAQGHSSGSCDYTGFHIGWESSLSGTEKKIVTFLYYVFIVIHTVAHFINAINFVQHYDAKFAEINWARDEDDVRRGQLPKLFFITTINHFPAFTQNVFRLMFLTPVGFSGWTMIACLVVIWTFSTRQMREYFYNSFLGVHHLFLFFFIMMYYHPVR